MNVGELRAALRDLDDWCNVEIATPRGTFHLGAIVAVRRPLDTDPTLILMPPPSKRHLTPWEANMRHHRQDRPPVVE